MTRETANSESARVSALAAEIRIVVGALIRRMREQTDPNDLTNARKSVLLRLERDGPATGTALARAEAMRPQSMGAIIAALEATGFVKGAPDPTDGRQTIISLTDRFRDLVKVSRAAKQDWLFRNLQTKFTVREQEQLATAIELLKRLVAP